jgi:hypothetical protein
MKPTSPPPDIGSLRDILLEAMDGRRARKPVAVTVMAGSPQSAAGDIATLLKSCIAAYPDAARAARALV